MLRSPLIQQPITKIEVAMLVYVAICSFVIGYAVSQSIIVSICMIPGGVGGIALSLPYIRYVQRNLSSSHQSPLMRTIGASIFPIALLAFCVHHAWKNEWMEAGSFLMLFGFSILLAMQHFLLVQESSPDSPVQDL